MIDAAIGIQIIEDAYINDYDHVRLTWRERLFSKPWRPWVKFKSVYNPKYYKVGAARIICSPQSAAQLRSHATKGPLR